MSSVAPGGFGPRTSRAVEGGEDVEAHSVTRFWHSDERRATLEDPEFTVDDTTLAVLERFRLITDLRLAD